MASQFAIKERRFEPLLDGHGTAIWDQTLMERPGWLVAPTIGAIVPNWYLLVSRPSALNFLRWSEISDVSPLQAVTDLRHHLGLELDEIIWFEHGAAQPETSIGCGVDHAHIHVLIRPPFDFSDFEREVRLNSDLDWVVTDQTNCYSEVVAEQSYLITGCGSRIIVARDVESVGSQFFRRMVAAMKEDTKPYWDYRLFPHTKNVAQSISTFLSISGGDKNEK